MILATRRYGGITNRRELKLLFFISPILLYVAELFGPEDSMKIVVEEDLNGVNVKANGHFELMLVVYYEIILNFGCTLCVIHTSIIVFIQNENLIIAIY